MAMHSDRYSFLKFVRYQDVLLWDIKRYFATQVLSSFPIVRLGDYINEESAKYSISDSAKTYGILGVNNQTGIFDAYKESGSKIKQKYKKMQVGWLAYNPYRINVGSIGIRTNVHNHEYISPAYVVFSCKRGLLPEFLFLMMKTELFNKTIRENTTGSVRQNLKFTVLSNLPIPFPSLSEQGRILSNYQDRIQEAKIIGLKVSQIELGIEKFFIDTLGATSQQDKKGLNNKYKHLKIVKFRHVLEWGVDIMQKKQEKETFKYPIIKIRNLCQLGSGGTPSRSCPQYYQGTLPWVKTGEVLNDEIFDTEEHITEEAIANSSAKLYPKGSLIIAMYGQGDTRGRTAKLGIEATTNQACAVLYDIDNNIVSTDYLWYYLQGRYHDLRSLASGNNQPNLNAGKIKDYDVVVPPMNIQNEIVAHIKEQKALAKRLKQKAKEIKESALKEFENEIFE